MKNNMFLKSTLRQPIRSMILFILIAATAFGFVMRTAEFAVVRERIFHIAGFYRTIGFLRPSGAPVYEGTLAHTADVLEAANLIANSRYIGFEDRRRGAVGLLHDMHNFDVFGMYNPNWADSAILMHPDTAEVAFINRPSSVTHTYFYAVVTSIFAVAPRFRVIVDEVIAGYPEHVRPGVERTIYLTRIPGEDWPAAELEVGGRYLFRAVWHQQWLTRSRGFNHAAFERRWSQYYDCLDMMYFFGAFRYLDLTLLPLNDDGLWFVPVPYGEADFTSPELVHIPADVAFLERNHRELQIRTTADMTAMPTTQDGFDNIVLREGRLLNRQDYLEARPVAVIHQRFAENRGLSIGDTFTVSILSEQRIPAFHSEAFIFGLGGFGRWYTILDLNIVQGKIFESGSNEFAVNDLELEIVGIYAVFPEIGLLRTCHTWLNTIVYIPDSLLPPDLVAVNEIGFADRYDFLFDQYYSFVISDPRNDDAFIRENSETLERLGFTLAILPNDADNFWASANPMLQAITVNFAAFLVVLLLVLGLVVFIYLHQKRREMAIARVLGISAKQVMRRACVPISFIGLPAIIIGGVLGFILSLRQSAATVSALDELRPDLIADVELSVLWLVLLIAAVFVTLITATVTAVAWNNRKSPLTLLQGSVGGAAPKKSMPSRKKVKFMKNKRSSNVFLKSTLRQPARSLILFVLIASAAFGFVLRTAEFAVVRERIFHIASFYRTIGFLQPSGAPVYEGTIAHTANVLEAANQLANSRYIGFEDRRRGAVGLLHDMHNFDVFGMYNPNWADRATTLPHPDAIEMNFVNRPSSVTHTYFYAEVTSIFGVAPRFRVIVDEVLVGYPEHVGPGMERTIYLTRIPGEDWPAAELEVGGRYLFRAAWHQQWLDRARGFDYFAFVRRWPGYDGETRFLRGTFAEMDLTLLPLNDEGLWFLPVPYGQADFTSPELAHIPADIAFLERNHRELQIRTTTDMTAMPITQDEFDNIVLREGRLLNRQDYLEARPVAVIHQIFARERGLSIGDTITVSIPDEQRFSAFHSEAFITGFLTHPFDGTLHTILGFDIAQDKIFESDSQEFAVNDLELEIVGLYMMFPHHGIPRIWHTWLNTIVYIPDSLLPPDLVAVNELGFADRYDYLFDKYYSFVISDPRNDDAFILENSETLERLGFTLTIIPNDADNFWASANPMLQAITVNFAVFLVVLLLVLGLVVFLYLHQKRREMAIARVLGISAKQVMRRICIPISFIGLPAIIIGGVLGFILSLRQSAATVSALDELRPDLIADVELSVLWLVLLISAVFITLITAAVVAVARNNRKSPLVLLQRSVGGAAVKNTYSAPEAEIEGQPRNEVQTALPSVQKIAIPTMPVETAKGNKTKHNANFILRHIVRSRVKSGLTVGVALFFVLALGFLQNAIYNSEREINRLYDTTVITAEVRSAELFAFSPLAPMGNFIMRPTVDNVLDFGFVQNPFLEAAYEHFFVIAPGEDGNFPEENLDDFWTEYWLYLRTLPPPLTWFAERCPVFAVNDLEMFIAETVMGGAFLELAEEVRLELAANPLLDEFLGGMGRSFEITFAEGFNMDDFVYADPSLEAPIPVIMSEFTMERRGLSLGGTAFLGHDFDRFPRRLVYPLTIIGTHNGMGQGTLNNAVIMPVNALHPMPIDPFGPTDPSVGYITVRFDIDPAYNRELDTIAEQIRAALDFREQNVVMGLDIFMQDDELRLVVGQMEENLSLLRILQPIAIAFSVIIGAGLSLLLMLQNAKTAAIMRVLGFTRKRTRLTLCFENLAVCLLGAVIGLFAILLFGNYISAMLPLFAVLYLLGTIIGSVIGAIMVSNRPPLELLQVKE